MSVGTVHVHVIPCQVNPKSWSANHRGRISRNCHAYMYIQKWIFLEKAFRTLLYYVHPAAVQAYNVFYCTVYVACSVHSCGVLQLADIGWQLTYRESVTATRPAVSSNTLIRVLLNVLRFTQVVFHMLPQCTCMYCTVQYTLHVLYCTLWWLCNAMYMYMYMWCGWYM